MSEQEPIREQPVAADPAQDRGHDVVVLGGGSAGYACALRCAELGLSVVLVEGDRLGGTCLHSGCIPTKALLHAAEVADAVRTSETFGVVSDFGHVDVAKLHAYKDGVVHRLARGLEHLVAGRGIEVVPADGVLVDGPSVEAGGRRYRGRHVVVATGSQSRSLPGITVDGRRILTSEHALALPTLPSSMIVLGGGAIGVEFASLMRSFGTAVTLVEALPRLLPQDDATVSAALEKALRRRGIKVKTRTSCTEVEPTQDDVRVVCSDGSELRGEVLLVAVGRGPRTAGLGLEEQGVQTERGFIRTDDRLRTSNPRIYAAGDVVAGLQLAHRGFQQGIFVAEDIAGLEPAVIDESGIPRVVYSDPEVVSVGWSEERAREHFGAGEIDTLTYELGGNGRSQVLKTAGLVKAVRLREGRILGLHMVGARISEQAGEAQLVVDLGPDVQRLAQLVHAHPTQNEALGETYLALAGKPLHSHA
ncbi:dihydrolipoyl dehydrogenase [Kineococcus aurantiacus]|uniref:Dihydrolipoyl dehydrogenase n=1 Tax=Kineococcus aurantiacus TaxID=37633 RepID=A0A7Y9J3C1_9ACTN|nr:dihydrolipoyl dehydrogenase [Kineococcus aurantiacus]NYD25089.1 dihydrolipoamide dehydrogenase [Kineococcus aurantiacus]